MLYSLLCQSTSNLGDEIQSLAAKRFLPKVDFLVSREAAHLAKRKGEAFLIANGWHCHYSHRFGYPKNIHPCFVGFHWDRFASFTKAHASYLKQYEPIGCRDTWTLRLLEKNGVNAYFSGCLTLTFPKSESKRGKGTLLVDVPRKYLTQIPKRYLQKVTTVSHHTDKFSMHDPLTQSLLRRYSRQIARTLYQVTESKKLALGSDLFYWLDSATECPNQNSSLVEERLSDAQNLLDQYASADLVITGRLHAALPCLAMQTPFIFLPADSFDFRFEGLRDLLGLESWKSFDKPNWEPVVRENISLANSLNDTVRKEIANAN